MRQIILVLLCLLLVACNEVTPSVVAPDPDPAQIKLAEAATSVSQSLQQLAAIQSAAVAPITTKQLAQADAYGMTGRASVDWSGPIGPLVKKIARLSHYHLRVLGNPPAIPIIISINAHNTPVGNILRDADFQAGRQANIRVYPPNYIHHNTKRIIELRYAHA